MKLWWQLAGPWIKQHWRISLLALCLALSTVFAGVGLLTVSGWFLTGAFLAGSSLAFNLFVPSALVRGLSMWRIASRYAERVCGHMVTLDLQAEIRTGSFARLAAFKPAQLAHYRDGDLLARLINDIERLDTFFLLIITPIFTAIIAGGFFSLLMGVALPLAGWILLLVLCLAAGVLPYLLARKTAVAGLEVQAANAELRALAHEAIDAHTDLLVFGVTLAAQEQFDRAGLRLAKAQQKVAQAGSFGTLIQQLLMGTLVLALLWLGANAQAQQELSAPVWVGLLLGSMGLFEILSPIMRGAAGLGAVEAAARRIQDLTASPAANTQAKAGQAQPTAILPATGPLHLQDVCVAHENQTVLSQLDLYVDHGQRIAIRGPSGTGKTTLLMAIMQVQPLTSGTITYGGVHLNTVNSPLLYQRMALLSQHSPVFMGTIRHNLLLADPQATDERLWEVLHQVHLASHIEQIGGLDAWTGEGGNTLSTGQIRRLCLARVLLSRASVWLLDEPTAGLDKTTADAWFTNLQQVAKDRTVIIVTHANLPKGVVDESFILAGGRLHLERHNEAEEKPQEELI
ncbi:thiol reductant ABC exporter subunit CydC [Advenella faeciporci]|uniref:Thiol reductant ABC exporter subunit CydC n=1 Tax=Advenella faeciporci TaxID=797535 RepID=A0A918JK74_9BURK|nr:thiol reductant ABC exporter subunit CydC [Advenella faeciporci]GGW84475.1 thiol reductant ABC exporter subunit CydC [Advenella faeciporci]